MPWEHIEYGLEGDVATITLSRPETRNALFGTMRTDLIEALDEASAQARVVVVTGAGEAFCSGGDVRHMSRLRRDNDLDGFRSLVEQGKAVVRRIRSLDIPTLASVRGPAVGAGFSLALACDLRIASTTARFGASFGRIGLHPDWGGTYFLTRLVGGAVARDLIFSGRVVDAEEAAALGLVYRVVADDALEKATLGKAQELARAAPASIRHAKETIALAEHAPLDDVLEREQEAQLACFATDDALEGIRAFEEKRPAAFKGK